MRSHKTKRIRAYCDLSTRETRASIQSNTIATSTAVNLNLSSIGLEVLSGIFSGNTALNSESALGDGFLSKTKLREGSASCDLNLRSNDIDTSDFLCVL